MGLFLSMSGVVGAGKAAVESALQSYAVTRGGSFRPAQRTTDQPDTIVLLEENNRCSVLYHWEFFEWDHASQFLSSHLNLPVFSFHIHDDDLWMFILFDRGEAVTRFNPIPEYWSDDISEEDRESWKGDADAIAAHIPDLSAEAIRPYLRHWDFEEQNPGKAFPGDQSTFHDCWQLCDFMDKIGLRYPLDQTGQILGETYEFVVGEHKG